MAYAFDVLNAHIRAHHQTGNVFIELEGTAAYAESYFTGYHRMRPKGDSMAADNAWDTEMDFWVGGRCVDRCQKRDGIWKMSHRTGLTDWVRTARAACQGLFATPEHLFAHRGAKDVVYRRREEFR